MKVLDYAIVFKALGDQTRLEIIKMLMGGEMCACKILEKFDITQPTLSYHMKALVESGLVECEKNGIWNYYSLNTKVWKMCLDFFDVKAKLQND